MEAIIEQQPLTYLILWLLGSIFALYLVAKKEKRRLGGKLFSHILEDIKENPVPSIIGFSLLFMSSWAIAIGQLFFKEKSRIVKRQ